MTHSTLPQDVNNHIEPKFIIIPKLKLEILIHTLQPFTNPIAFFFQKGTFLQIFFIGHAESGMAS